MGSWADPLASMRLCVSRLLDECPIHWGLAVGQLDIHREVCDLLNEAQPCSRLAMRGLVTHEYMIPKHTAVLVKMISISVKYTVSRQTSRTTFVHDWYSS